MSYLVYMLSSFLTCLDSTFSVLCYLVHKIDEGHFYARYNNCISAWTIYGLFPIIHLIPYHLGHSPTSLNVYSYTALLIWWFIAQPNCGERRILKYSESLITLSMHNNTSSDFTYLCLHDLNKILTCFKLGTTHQSQAHT